MLRQVLDNDNNPNGIIVGEYHQLEGPEVVKELLANVSYLKDKGFTHIGLEVFKTGKYRDGDESKGLVKYTSGQADQEDPDVQCAFRKAELLDMRNYLQERGIKKYLSEVYDMWLERSANKDYQTIYEASKNNGYRQLLEEMRKHKVIGFGLEPAESKSRSKDDTNVDDDRLVIDGNKLFSEQINAIKITNIKTKLCISCGAIHLVKYETKQEKTSGLAEEFKLTPYFYSGKSRAAVLAFPDKIDKTQIASIPVIKQPVLKDEIQKAFDNGQLDLDEYTDRSFKKEIIKKIYFRTFPGFENRTKPNILKVPDLAALFEEAKKEIRNTPPTEPSTESDKKHTP